MDAGARLMLHGEVQREEILVGVVLKMISKMEVVGGKVMGRVEDGVMARLRHLITGGEEVGTRRGSVRSLSEIDMHMRA
jgi:hypothetical protein